MAQGPDTTPTGALAPLLLAALLSLGGAGCIAAVPHAEPEVLAAARPMFPAYTAEELEADRAAYVENCTGCHVLATGRRHPVEEWPTHVQEMQIEVFFDDATGAQITRYLQTSRLFWEAETERRRAEREARSRSKESAVVRIPD